MSDLIDRQAAIKKVQAYHCRYPEYMDGFVSKVLSAIKADLVEDIEEMPTAEPKVGRWESDRLVSTSGGTYGVRRCSECEAYYQDVGYGWNYCPNCGARMEGEDNAAD